MIRSTWVSYVVGLLTLWPVVYLVGFVAWTFVLLVGRQLPEGGSGMPTWFVVLGVLHVTTILLSFALIAVYVVDVLRNPRLEGSDMRVVWVVLVILAGLGAMPVYWWLHLRPGGEAFRSRAAALR